MDTVIVNDCLNLAMEWGPDWMKPTQERMRKLYPSLTDAELNQYDAVARSAMHVGFNLMYDQPDSTYEQTWTPWGRNSRGCRRTTCLGSIRRGCIMHISERSSHD